MRQDSDIDLLLVQDELVVKPVAAARFSLRDLLSGVTDDNRHHEVETSGPVGDEVW